MAVDAVDSVDDVGTPWYISYDGLIFTVIYDVVTQITFRKLHHCRTRYGLVL